jgi:ubiquitin C-terminal hydrolase
MGISVDVRGKQNLLDSLSSYVQGELMEGENAYYCEEVGRKVDAVKRACVKALPTTLIIHLKRFEFDFDTMLRWKIRDRFEFPTNLNMYEYTVEGLAKAEGTTDKEVKLADPFFAVTLWFRII